MVTGGSRLGQLRSPWDQRQQLWQKAQFKIGWHFCRTDFGYDEWLCRICDRFNPHPSGVPVLYRKRDAIKHEKTSEHQCFVDQHRKFVAGHPELLRKHAEVEMGWGPVGDLVSPSEVYDTLRWDTPDVRKGVDFVNQFVAFWVEDVAAASAEVDTNGLEEKERVNGMDKVVGREAQMGHSRRTFEEFFESIVVESLAWDFPSGNVYEDGWGTPAVPVPNVNVEETTKEGKNGRGGASWVTHRNGKEDRGEQGGGRGGGTRGRGRGRGGGRGRGRGKGTGHTGHQPSSGTAGMPGRTAQVASRNLFAQLQLVDEAGG